MFQAVFPWFLAAFVVPGCPCLSCAILGPTSHVDAADAPSPPPARPSGRRGPQRGWPCGRDVQVTTWICCNKGYSHPQIDGKLNHHWSSRDLFFHLFGDDDDGYNGIICKMIWVIICEITDHNRWYNLDSTEIKGIYIYMYICIYIYIHIYIYMYLTRQCNGIAGAWWNRSLQYVSLLSLWSAGRADWLAPSSSCAVLSTHPTMGLKLYWFHDNIFSHYIPIFW